MADPRVRRYEIRYSCRFHDMLGLGAGQDGFVMRSDRLTAVKFFDRRDRFDREYEVYQILRQKGIFEIAGHNVPELIRGDTELLAIEMKLVERPFLLDFGGAKRPEEVPDFEQHVLDEYVERLVELFGDDWSNAIHVAEMFRQATGFVLTDIHPGNIAFAD